MEQTKSTEATEALKRQNELQAEIERLTKALETAEKNHTATKEPLESSEKALSIIRTLLSRIIAE